MPPIIHPRQPALHAAGAPLPYGAYDDIIRDTSTRTWDSEGGLLKRRRSQRKAWIFAGAYTEHLMVGIAVADAGYLANAFAYFYVPGERLYREEKVLLPFGFPGNFDPGLNDEWKLGNFRIATERGRMVATVRGKFTLELDLDMNENGLSFICPATERPFNFTYKNLCLQAAARVTYQGRAYNLEGQTGGVDFSKGYPPRLTRWNWAMVSGHTSEGIPIGLNLCDGHNGKYENAAWIGGERVLLPLPGFVYDRNLPADGQDWRIRTPDGSLDMAFTPWHARSENINARLIRHDFVQPFGKFSGEFRVGAKTHRFTGYGPVEEHESLW